MGIRYTTGDILDSIIEAVVNPVNCVGIMGAGLAKQFGDTYPKMLKDYKEICQYGGLFPGQLHIFDREVFSPPFFIINFPTKKDWRNPSKLEYIEAGLLTLVRIMGRLNIKNISIPKLGCGLGGLNWYNVNSLIKKYLSDVGVEVVVYGEDV